MSTARFWSHSANRIAACRRFHAKIKKGVKLERKLFADGEEYEEKRVLPARNGCIIELVTKRHACKAFVTVWRMVPTAPQSAASTKKAIEEQ